MAVSDLILYPGQIILNPTTAPIGFESSDLNWGNVMFKADVRVMAENGQAVCYNLDDAFVFTYDGVQYHLLEEDKVKLRQPNFD